MLDKVKSKRISTLICRGLLMKNRMIYIFFAFSKESARLTIRAPIILTLFLVVIGISDDRDAYFYIRNSVVTFAIYMGMIALLGSVFTLLMASGIGRWGAAYSAFASKEDIFAFVHNEVKNLPY